MKELEIMADYDDGVLEISMAKVAKVEELPKAKEIPVKQAPKPLKV